MTQKYNVNSSNFKQCGELLEKLLFQAGILCISKSHNPNNVPWVKNFTPIKSLSWLALIVVSVGCV